MLIKSGFSNAIRSLIGDQCCVMEKEEHEYLQIVTCSNYSTVALAGCHELTRLNSRLQ